MIVVADTTPVNYLILIGEIDVLAKLYGRVVIPPAVHDELTCSRAPESVRGWIAQPPAWLEFRLLLRLPTPPWRDSTAENERQSHWPNNCQPIS